MQVGIAEVIGGLNLLGLGGLGLFIYYVIRGLRERIQALTDLAAEQQKTLEVVRTRALELDQLRKDYRQAVDDFQDLGHKLEERRKAVISDLEAANKQKDDELARLKSLELEEIELKKRSLDKVGELEHTLAATVSELQRQVRIVTPNTHSVAFRESYLVGVLMPFWRSRASRRALSKHSSAQRSYAQWMRVARLPAPAFSRELEQR
jgi:hypothetical protein